MKRVHSLDSFRGFTIVSMVLYHLFYDLVYIFNCDISFYTIENVRPWQISIAVSFFTISGISATLSERGKLLKRGLILTLLGILITLVTSVAIPDERIVFGVLSGLGASMIILYFSAKALGGFDERFLAPIFLVLFLIFYSISSGVVNLFFAEIPVSETLYEHNLFFLGFPSREFTSSDYFPLIPWVFIYHFGYFLGLYLKKNDFFGIYGRENILSKIGRHSLVIYLLHQVVIYMILYLFFTWWR
ncbi:MAG: heparan-alpha-glucosaminide N-acetyltransferase domain-containing protein [Peptoniphilus sp.]|nr:heparan-alpha-glucosaminide N-acetyltransferase domain-containing protein [Peptoniphilus sp.]